ncbi:hypothetical protein HRS9139_02375 [Pyrenophora teres f. teres]|uniref:Tol protein n=1 Tax=Pyrenophora teres f. teres TaxID=97479 RepID=A0A6S6VS97_9PLEO|nr:hypothetical protein HRS9139_02375 [Pyrenophora teres f. teres]KAE8852109.1 hypothetical protein HRS9122_02396 [Pyrenophora teres f. teres]KAE8870780.1 hypothetical protein PTNB29_01124 [Pyrenophora teres f. teres]CAE7014457.1 Tol protein [Pyrenophora teres f. teres]
MQMCQYLGIPYIWIDALCILQDSKEDWEEAAATMANIYENSYVTIAATFARNSNEGLFSNRDPAALAKRLKLHPYLHVMEAPVPFPHNLSEQNLDLWPLLARAWVYQERMFSPRTIHFGKYQVYWRCNYHFASEDGCEDMIWSRNQDILGSLENWSENSSFDWHRSVTEYTGLELTYETDRLPAIAAVAERISRTLRADDIYVAGLWKDSIISDMLWCPMIRGRRTPLHKRGKPSWSWASYPKMKITFLGDPDVPYMAEFVGLDYTAVGSTYLGEVKDASVVVNAPTLTITDPDGLSSIELKDLMEYPAEYFRDTLPRKYGQRYPMSFEPLPAEWGNCHLGVFLRNDYDPTTAIPPYTTGTVLKVQLFQRSEASESIFGRGDKVQFIDRQGQFLMSGECRVEMPVRLFNAVSSKNNVIIDSKVVIPEGINKIAVTYLVSWILQLPAAATVFQLQHVLVKDVNVVNAIAHLNNLIGDRLLDHMTNTIAAKLHEGTFVDNEDFKVHYLSTHPRLPEAVYEIMAKLKFTQKQTKNQEKRQAKRSRQVAAAEKDADFKVAGESYPQKAHEGKNNSTHLEALYAWNVIGKRIVANSGA